MKNRELTITGRYLILPVCRGLVNVKSFQRQSMKNSPLGGGSTSEAPTLLGDTGRMHLSGKGAPDHDFTIKLGDERCTDYEVFLDLTAYTGNTIQIEYDGEASLDGVYCSDQIPNSHNVYQESLRPQFHFSSRRGWINDPNGLVYYDGTYHMFYQTNPYGTEWGNMHWGHAVSSDLVHWQDQEIVLYPDSLGTMFSGCAVVDHQNTSGLGTSSHPPILLFYTAAGEFVRPKTEYTQCMAFSVDGGLSWNKYDGNPVVQSIKGKNRDPKVIWHQASEHWVMALYLERNSYVLLTSPNLVDWTQTCDIELPGATECPDFFPLSVDNNPDNVRWVFWGGNTTYLVGTFDGQRFDPETTPRKLQPSGCHYAAQTFSNIPESDGRRVMIAWTQQQLPGMPFSQFMSVPHSLRLTNDQNGMSLSADPIHELEIIREDSWEIIDQDLTNGVHLEAEIKGELLDVEATINLGKADCAGIVVRGVSVWYDRLNGGLFNGARTSQISPGLEHLTLRIIADRASVEMFGPMGSTVMISNGTVMNPSNHTVQFFAVGNGAVVSKARVSRLRSVWDISTDID